MSPPAGPQVSGTRIQWDRYIKEKEGLYLDPGNWRDPNTLVNLKGLYKGEQTDRVAAATALNLACMFDSKQDGPDYLGHIEIVYKATEKQLEEFIYPQLRKLETFSRDEQSELSNELHFLVTEFFDPDYTMTEKDLDDFPPGLQKEFLVQALQLLTQVVEDVRADVDAHTRRPKQWEAELFISEPISHICLFIDSHYNPKQSVEQQVSEQPDAEQSPRQGSSSSSEREEEPEVEAVASPTPAAADFANVSPAAPAPAVPVCALQVAPPTAGDVSQVSQAVAAEVATPAFDVQADVGAMLAAIYFRVIKSAVLPAIYFRVIKALNEEETEKKKKEEAKAASGNSSSSGSPSQL